MNGGRLGRITNRQRKIRDFQHVRVRKTVLTERGNDSASELGLGRRVLWNMGEPGRVRKETEPAEKKKGRQKADFA